MSTILPQIRDQLSNLVNSTMFPHGVRIHAAQLCASVKVIDTAKNSVSPMPVLVITIQPEGTTTTMDQHHNNNNSSSTIHNNNNNDNNSNNNGSIRQVFLGLPSLSSSNTTMFGDVIMGVALYTHPACPGCCLYNSEVDVYEVAIKRSAVKHILARVSLGGEANEENPLNEIALMEHMQRVVSNRTNNNTHHNNMIHMNNDNNHSNNMNNDNEIVRFADVFPHNMSLELAATDGTTLFTILPRMKHCMDLFAYCFENNDIKCARASLSFNERMQEAKMILRAVFRGVLALHQQGIAHRDISLENCLISVTCNNGNLHIDDVKVIDYGMAVMNAHLLMVRRDQRNSNNSMDNILHSSSSPLSSSSSSSPHAFASLDAEPMFDFEEDDMIPHDDDVEHDDDDNDNNNVVEDDDDDVDEEEDMHVHPRHNNHHIGACTTPFYGKIMYAPPECFYPSLSSSSTATSDPRHADIWACGIALFTLTFHQVLFTQAHHQRDGHDRFKILYKDPQHGLKRLLQEVLSSCVCHQEPLLVDLLCRMLRLVPRERWTMEQVLQHPWFQQA